MNIPCNNKYCDDKCLCPECHSKLEHYGRKYLECKKEFAETKIGGPEHNAYYEVSDILEKYGLYKA